MGEEQPVRQTLFRQSSLETRLYPEEDPGSSGDSDQEKEETQLREHSDSTRPRVVSMVAKSPRPDTPPPVPRRLSSLTLERELALQPLEERAHGTCTLNLREDVEGYSIISELRAKEPETHYTEMTKGRQSLPTQSSKGYTEPPEVPPRVTTAKKIVPLSEEVEYSVPKKHVSDDENRPSKLEEARDSLTVLAAKQKQSVDSTLVLARPCVSVASSEDSPATTDPETSTVLTAESSAPQVVVMTPANSQSAPGEATLRRVRFQQDEIARQKEADYEEIVVAQDEDNEYAEVQQPSVGILTAVTSASIMASPRPKSPRPGNVSARAEKEESFWEKIGTLGRKKRIKEVQEVQDEGKYAIDSPGNPLAPDLPPEDYALEENEERSMIAPQSYENPRLRELMAVLTEWINDELASHRIIVKDLEEDLYDGQVLHKLIETLTGERLDVPEVTQSEEGQRQKLDIVLATANKVLGLPRWSQQKWSVDSIHSKNVITILHLLVALARHFRAPVRLPERVAVQVVVVQMHGGALSHRTVTEEITTTYDDLGPRGERDAFDTLFDHAPDKLQVVKKSLVTFVNKHLNKLGLEVTDLDTQFHDGVYLALLMGLLEGFFVPLYAFHNTPHDFDQKVHNVSLAFDLMQEVGLARPKARPEDIVNLDLKSTLRVLYNLFTKYKGMS